MEDSQEILKTAIRIASINGWKPISAIFEGKLPEYDEDLRWWISDDRSWHLNEVIFDHDFAKALWGEDALYVRDIYPTDVWNASHMLDHHAWRFHLQTMVVAEDPIRYLADNMPEDK